MNLTKPFRIVALTEATSFLLLIVAAIVKRSADQPIGVEVLGPIHGALFLAYCALTLLVRSENGWNIKTTVVVLAGAVVPLGGYAVDRWMAKRDLAH